jgi:ribonuclease D
MKEDVLHMMAVEMKLNERLVGRPRTQWVDQEMEREGRCGEN